jgi:hypothetical protein
VSRDAGREFDSLLDALLPSPDSLDLISVSPLSTPVAISGF